MIGCALGRSRRPAPDISPPSAIKNLDVGVCPAMRNKGGDER
jgi:hypothetical protein